MLDLLGWAKRFIATPSVSEEGSSAIAESAADLLAQSGLAVRLQRPPGYSPEQVNVIAEGGPRAGRGLLLLTHLDTVPPGDPAAWTATGGDPFRPTLCGDLLYGLGSADAKVDLVCKAVALAGIDAKGLRRRVRVVGTFGEEIGLRGARYLVESGETAGFAFALVGEPSGLAAIRAHKGYAVLEARIPLPRVSAPPSGRVVRLEIRGVAAHSSTPALGRNAVEEAIDHLAGEDVAALIDIAGGEVVNRVPDRCTIEILLRGAGASAVASRGSPPLDPRPLVAFLRAWRARLAELARTRDPQFDPDHTLGSLGPIRLEGTDVVLRFDLRPLPGVDAAEAVRPLEGHARVTCLRANPPLETPAESALLCALTAAQRRVGIEERVETKATCTEAGLLAATGIESVVFGPGRSVGNVHRPNEHTRVSELERAVRIYREVVRELCVEGSPCSS
jgi:succinyl-diaminopimelate desuccinylase